MKKMLCISLLLSLTLSACEISNRVDITLHLNGGTINNKDTLVLSLRDFKRLNEYPKLHGKIFSSYYYDQYFSQRFEGNYEITKSIDLYAKYYDDIFEYQLEDNTYSITKVVDDIYSSITVPDYIENTYVKKIKKEAIKNITVNKLFLRNIEEIEKDAFINSSINYLEIGNQIKKIEYGAFRKVKNLRAVKIDENSHYSAVNNVILEKLPGDERVIIGNYGYDKSMFNEDQLSTVDIVSIAPYSFSNLYVYNDKLNIKGYTFYIPSTVSEISESAFEDCNVYCYNDDEQIKIQLGFFFFDNIEIIHKNAFANSAVTLVKYEIQKVVRDNVVKFVPSETGIETFGEGAFQNTELKKIILPKTLKKIEKNCFYSCDVLTEIYYEGSPEEYKKIIIEEEGNEALLNANVYYYSETKEIGRWYYECDPNSKIPYLGTPTFYK